LLFVPMHVSALFVWMAHQILRNVLGHCGVELEPRSWLAGWWGRWITTTLHHDMHHAQGRHNYGLYFTWWDRVCGTEHPQYRERLQHLIDTIDVPTSLHLGKET
jgi:Delta7-sterol 5-desaturase